LYPYNQYAGHFVLGVIYTKCDDVADERQQFTLDQLEKIPSVIKDFQFFVQPKYKIASARPGSGNTKNIGSVTSIDKLINGTGPFAALGEPVYDDYWMYYLTKDMAYAVGVERPYTNLATYAEYKKRGSDVLEKHAEEIAKLGEEEAAKAEEES
jgi:restriction endonuclease EcoRV